MAKSPTNISLDPDLKSASIALFADLGMDLSTAITVFLKQAQRVHGFPFAITQEVPNATTVAAMNEYYAMKDHPEQYKRYSSFREAMDEVLSDA